MILQNFLFSIIDIFESLLSVNVRQNIIAGLCVLFGVFVFVNLFLSLFRAKN